MAQETQTTNPLKYIRKHCLECCGFVRAEVTACTSTKCQLYPFRMGTNPFKTKRTLSPEQRERAAQNLKKAAASRRKEQS